MTNEELALAIAEAPLADAIQQHDVEEACHLGCQEVHRPVCGKTSDATAV
jgi:hypothetical protein